MMNKTASRLPDGQHWASLTLHFFNITAFGGNMLATLTGLDWGNAERRPKMLSLAGVDMPLMVTGVQLMGAAASLSAVGGYSGNGSVGGRGSGKVGKI